MSKLIDLKLGFNFGRKFFHYIDVINVQKQMDNFVRITCKSINDKTTMLKTQIEDSISDITFHYIELSDSYSAKKEFIVFKNSIVFQADKTITFCVKVPYEENLSEKIRRQLNIFTPDILICDYFNVINQSKPKRKPQIKAIFIDI